MGLKTDSMLGSAGQVKLALGEPTVGPAPVKLPTASTGGTTAGQALEGEALVVETFSRLFPDSFQHVMPVLNHKVSS